MPDPVMQQQPKKISLAGAMAKALRKAFTKEQDPEEAREAAQALAERLPAGVNPTEAIRMHKERLRRLAEEPGNE